jgi:hypothetical protein
MSRSFEALSHDEHDQASCRRCGDAHPRSTLDRDLWCPSCHAGLERKAKAGQHLIAALITLPFLIWILAEGTRGFLPTWAWSLPLLVAYYLGMRIGRAVIKGYMRR